MIAFFGCAWLGRILSCAGGNFTPFWPPAGLLVGTLLIVDTRRWPIYLAAGFIADLAFDQSLGRQLVTSIPICFGDVLQGYVVSLFIRRFVARFMSLDSVKQLLGFLLVTAIGTGISASIGVASSALRGGTGFSLSDWRVWWSGDLMGVILFTPLLLTWVSRSRWPIPRPRLARAVEALLLMASLAVFTWLIFSTHKDFRLARAYLLFPFLIWAALRFEMHGSAMANVLLSILVVYFSSRGLGEFGEPDAPHNLTMLAVQVFLSIMASTTLVLAAVLSERRRSEETSYRSRQLLEATFASLRAAIFIVDAETTKIVDCNNAAATIFGYTRQEMLGRTTAFLHASAGALVEFRARLQEAMAREGRLESLDFRMKRKDGSIFETTHSVSELKNRNGERIGWVSIVRDISDRRQTEAALKKAEEQLLQSQKMEAVGRLAAGVAHDFNNLLTSIIGNSDIAEERNDIDGLVRESLREIRQAAGRAAELTQQLLAFGRKQMLQPRVVSLNDLIAGIEKMLRRLISEDIELVIHYDSEDGLIFADPGQIEQVIVNLALNARDAMPDGGNLTLETRCLLVDKTRQAERPEQQPGEYVMLAVSDSGIGMDTRVQAHLFEPYFTTKERGKGSGLGLSTVYGIVKQSNGYIYVYSEPGMGATFKIYLPRIPEPASPSVNAPERIEPRGGTEVIMLAEDEASVRSLSTKVLRSYGYRVLEAAGGEQALLAAETLGGPIDLLVTDIIMPGMSGKELSQRLARQCPGMRTLFISGYTENVIFHQGTLDPGIRFLQKPFAPRVLARMVREVLDAEGGAPASST